MGVGAASVATSGAAWEEIIDPEGSGAGPRLPREKGKELSPLWMGEQEGSGHTVTAINVPLNVPSRRLKALESGKTSFLLTGPSAPIPIFPCILTLHLVPRQLHVTAEKKAEVVSFVVPCLTQTVWTAGPARSSEVAMPDLSTWWKSEKHG